MNDWFAPAFKQPLLDLGEHESPAFAGVLSPRDEVGTVRAGVNAVFLEDAETYYQRHQGFDYWFGLLKSTTDRLQLLDVTRIVEFGCGFGNSTIPMLDLFPNSTVVATDISPNLLAILRRLINARSLQDRCIPVAMDAQKDYITQEYADVVMGSAVLHHLAEPGNFVRSAMKILKPGGVAFFYEPLEGGYSILRMAC